MLRIRSKQNICRIIRPFSSIARPSQKLDVNHETASTIVIGGGIAGTSIAYHLARLGQKGVTLLEKSELTAGSTWHAAGLTTTYHPVINLKKIHYSSLEFYSKIATETGQEIGFHQSGSIRVARTPMSVDEFRYQMSRSGNQSAPQCLLTPNEVHKLVPLILPEKILMGLYNPYDGHIDPYSLTQAIAKGAKMHGASILQGVKVESLSLKSNGTWLVATSKGIIVADNVVNAAGFHAKDVGALVGLNLPLVAVEHQYLVTSSVPEIQGLKKEFPVLRDLAASCYIRQERDGFLVGLYESEPSMKLRDQWALNGVPEEFGKELFESDIDRMMPHLEQVMEVIPSLQTANIQTVVNGPITYAPDGLPLIGPSEIPNFWLAAGFGYGIVHGGGIGKFLAEWIISGEPTHDLIECDPGRFGAWTSNDYVFDKCRESYAMNAISSYPDEERFAGRPTCRVTPAFEKQIERGASMEISHGWEHPGWFSELGSKPEYKPSFFRTNWHEAVEREWKSVKTAAGIIDLSTFGKYLLDGPQSTDFLDRITANKVPKVKKSVVTHLLTPAAKVAAELTITQLEKDQFFIITGSGSEGHDLSWMKTIAREEEWNVNFSNISDQMGCLSVAGPNSKDILTILNSRFGEKFPFFTADKVSIGGIIVEALRLTYTGELGWELYCPLKDTAKLYEAILEAGKKFELADFGTKTLNALRLEKGFRMWSREMSHNTTVIEAGLLPFVHMEKEDFIGKDSILQQLQHVQPNQLIMIKIDKNAPCDPRGDESIWVGNKIVGCATSGCFSPLLQQPLAFAYVPTFLSSPGSSVEIELMGQKYCCEVLAAPPDLTFTQRKK